MNALCGPGRAVVVVSALLAGSACTIDGFDLDCSSRGCRNDETRTYDFKDFDSIQIQNTFRVSVQAADEFRVSVTVPESVVGDLDVRRDGRQLVIGVRGSNCWCRERRVAISLPVLRRLDATDASEVTLSGRPSSGTLELYLSDASHVKGDASADVTILHLRNASDADLSGTTGRLELEAVDASNARLRGLSAQRADVVLRDASSAVVSVADHLDVTASDASSLRYAGNPVLGRVELSDASILERDKQ